MLEGSIAFTLSAATELKKGGVGSLTSTKTSRLKKHTSVQHT